MAKNDKYLNLTAVQVEASFGKEGKAAFDALLEANRMAGEARKALHEIVASKVPTPEGKTLVTKAQWGKLSIWYDDGAPKAAKPKQSLADWLASQNAA